MDRWLALLLIAVFVMASGSMSSNASGEGGIRQKIIEADSVVSLQGPVQITGPGSPTQAVSRGILSRFWACEFISRIFYIDRSGIGR